VKTYLCTECGGSITVGHPAALFRRQARAMASGWLSRLLRRSASLSSYVRALEERHYLGVHCYRRLPRACPRCGHRGVGDLPWWRPGVAYPD
jgi:hypothetical protein